MMTRTKTVNTNALNGTISVSVRSAMLAADVSIEELAAMTGISQRRLRWLLDGEVSWYVNDVGDVAEALQVDPGALVSPGI